MIALFFVKSDVKRAIKSLKEFVFVISLTKVTQNSPQVDAYVGCSWRVMKTFRFSIKGERKIRMSSGVVVEGLIPPRESQI